MTPKEIFDTKRENFVCMSLKCFQFLIYEFDFNEPVHQFWEQENGTITRDQFRYDNVQIGTSVIISNSYHPYDYGFEINLHNLNVDKLDERQFIYYVLKEDQNIEQTYLENAAEVLRKHLKG